MLVIESRNGFKYLTITLPEHPRRDMKMTLTEAVSQELSKRGISPQTLVEGVDVISGGVHAWLLIVCTIVTGAGVALLLRRPGTERFQSQQMETPRAERREKKIAAIGLAAGMGGPEFVVAGLCRGSPSTGYFKVQRPDNDRAACQHPVRGL